MCQFFSAIYTRQHNIHFTEEDSHEVVIKRLGLRDDNLFIRNWVRVEYVDGNLRVDETSIPSWFDHAEAKEKVRAVYERVLPAQEAYDAAIASAEKAYDAAIAPAWEAYDAAKAPAQEAYKAAIAPAWEAYKAAIAPAQEAYDAAKASAQEAYKAAI